MPRLLYVVAEQANGERTYDEIAERVTEQFGRGVNPDNVRLLVEKQLRPLGVLAQPDGSTPEVKKLDPMLALKFRAALVPKKAVRAITTIFYPFFFPPVVLAVLAGLVAVDIWFFFVHGVAQPARELVYNPILLLMVFGLIVVATALHEIGHATAARYGGAEPGVMGAGIYVVWPAFYTDVTDAYRLNRKGRLRTDLGGVYFNGLFILATAGAYALTRFEPLLILIVVQHFMILQQALPFLRLDGYYVLSDLTGVPDLFARLKPTLKSALPGKDTDEKAEELKPWVRVVTTGWVVAMIPILLFVFGLMIFNFPRIFATAWDSFFVQTDKVTDSFGNGKTAAGFAGILQTSALVLPVAGMVFSFGRGGGRLLSSAWSWSEGAPLRRAGVVVVSGLLALTAGYVLLPNGDYRPVQRAERGTIQGGLSQFQHVFSGRPGLTEERRDELQGAPVQRDAPGEGDESEPVRPEDRNRSTTTGQTTTMPTETSPETNTGETGTVETPARTATVESP
jgi:putative peptide zinc metalloprotease protein